MPVRKVPLVNGEMYHVINRGIDGRLTFGNKREYIRAIRTLDYYRYQSPPLRLSKFLDLPVEKRANVLNSIKRGDLLVDIVCYCFMPNHIHFLLRQNIDKGISDFMRLFQNSYTRYFNTKNERQGPLFLDQFKAVHIGKDDELLHVSRYIHLNPYSAYLVKSFENLIEYEWSSLPEYLGCRKTDICEAETVLSFFKKTNEYRKFVFNNKDYQRRLQALKHLFIE
ncbi:transposase [Candidatus Microgenomates bacterium]|nr:transposase [Candidatus Microgenomates bacterium]